MKLIGKYFADGDISELIDGLQNVECDPEFNAVFLMILSMLESAEDSALDTFGASNKLSPFLARTVIERSLTPWDLEAVQGKSRQNGTGEETVCIARLLMAARPACVRFCKCWDHGSCWPVEDAEEKIMKLLEKYWSLRLYP